MKKELEKIKNKEGRITLSIRVTSFTYSVSFYFSSSPLSLVGTKVTDNNCKSVLGKVRKKILKKVFVYCRLHHTNVKT